MRKLGYPTCSQHDLRNCVVLTTFISVGMTAGIVAIAKLVHRALFG